MRENVNCVCLQYKRKGLNKNFPTKIRQKERRNDGMKFNSIADVKGKYTTQVSMKLQTFAEEPKNTASNLVKISTQMKYINKKKKKLL